VGGEKPSKWLAPKKQTMINTHIWPQNEKYLPIQWTKIAINVLVGVISC
jgi:hypothetical protein